ncbi:hypothetical protein HYW18_00870 [Candidatus Uhrbacteria bacterium]|nr:hypothetical protein [Candidatus Uhrbacteria bacterium]
MIYMSIGVAITIFATIFLVYGVKHHDREVLMGSIPVLAVGIFVVILSYVVFRSQL